MLPNYSQDRRLLGQRFALIHNTLFGVLSKCPLRVEHHLRHRQHAVGIQRDGLNAAFHQPAGDFGKVRRRLAADADVLAALRARADGQLHQLQYRRG